ncbi:pyruvate formate lyase activating enzyme [Paucidesulfovibrio gracilis DSM 16080]|uniref:Pyruvate formate lyase activating enzyme n=1 Tax=Paucidesulfovibrio gracilis DSM 16080 TaxID=1121449 RepID=A0A1T4W8F4_9BACT|nr:anaerobic ribonucleoside-triphosphate reductase activating protein [Paucidesulfovibrio gracilis]SKA73318.1 pyruvate formate lyase activating enzyme [Paucidesulfovibrio gracilis DSM 16080]
MQKPTGVWNHVRGLERFSLCDWPGVPCCVIFLGGCNLLCPTCHNFELAWNMERVPLIPQWAIRAYLDQRKKWLDGVTVTGGEPTHVPGLAELLLEIKQRGMRVKLDTNAMRPDVVRDLLHEDLVDVFAVDVKGPYAKYPQLTGNAVDAETAQNNVESIFQLAAQNPEAFYFRTTRVPALNNMDMDEVRTLLPRGFELKVQEFVPPRRKHAVADNEERRTVGNVVN